MDKTWKISSQKVGKLDFKDSKPVDKMHSKNIKEKMVSYSTDGKHYLVITGDADTFNFSLEF